MIPQAHLAGCQRHTTKSLAAHHPLTSVKRILVNQLWWLRLQRLIPCQTERTTTLGTVPCHKYPMQLFKGVAATLVLSQL